MIVFATWVHMNHKVVITGGKWLGGVEGVSITELLGKQIGIDYNNKL